MISPGEVVRITNALERIADALEGVADTTEGQRSDVEALTGAVMAIGNHLHGHPDPETEASTAKLGGVSVTATPDGEVTLTRDPGDRE